MSAIEMSGSLLILTAGVEFVKNRSLMCAIQTLAISEVAASISCGLEVVRWKEQEI